MRKFILSFKTCFRILFRTRDQVFWCLLFPILLSTMFRFAFAGLITESNFTVIPVAVSSDIPLPDKVKSGVEDAMKDVLKITWADSESQAEELLADQKADGAVRLNSSLSLDLTVRAGSSLGSSIIESIVENFNLTRNTIVQTYREDGIIGVLPLLMKLKDAMPPEAADSRVSADASGADSGPSGKAGGKDSDAPASFTGFSYISHTLPGSASTDIDIDLSRINFYSLIGMFCMFACMSGLSAVIMTQANLSEFGRRTALSSAARLEVMSGFLAASFLVQYICIMAGLIYMNFVLKVGFGSDLALILLITAAGCLCGVCMGFFVGSIGNMKEGAKNAILMIVVFGGSALAGLFGGNGFIEIEHSAPFLNRINPVTLISDALYATSLNGGPARCLRDVLNLTLIALALFFGGIFMQRKKQYDSL